jgi:hypothetical protein
MKKIILICLPFLATACTTDVYIPGVSTPTVHYSNGHPQQYNGNYQHSYQSNGHYQQPYNNQQHHESHNEHHDNGKHKGQHKHKHHDD